jgi:hypothetical protein
LEPAAMGARIAEVPIELEEVDKPRRIAWFHLPQVWHVMRQICLGKSKGARDKE